MASFYRYLVSFTITHIFFAVFLFFGLGIFTALTNEQQEIIYPFVFYLCIIGTIAQSLVFTAIARFIDISGIYFFAVALIIELLVANSFLFYFIANHEYTEEVTDPILLNVSLLAALFITMLIKEYNVQER